MISASGIGEQVAATVTRTFLATFVGVAVEVHPATTSSVVKPIKNQYRRI
jgi:hypothetical protein